MQLIIFGIIAVVGVVVYFCYSFFTNKKKRKIDTCQSCGYIGGGSCSESLSRITAVRDVYSHDGKHYKITFYFKCKKCGNERSVMTRHFIEYRIKDDIIAAVRGIAYNTWGIPSISIPAYKVEIEY